MIERVPVLVVAADGAPSLEIARVARESGCSPILCDDRASARRALVANRLFIAIVEAGDHPGNAADLCSWLRQQPGGRQLRIIACNPAAWAQLLPLIDAGADDIASYQGGEQTLGGRLAIAAARLRSRHRESPIDFLAGNTRGDAERPHLLPHELLTRIRQMAWDETELPRLYRSFVEGAAAAFGFSQIAIYTTEQSMLVLQHLVGFDRNVDHIPFDRGIIGKAARTGRPIVIEDVSKEPDYIGGVSGINSEICVPFRAEGEVIGVINIESMQDSVLDERDLPLVLALRDHLEAAIARIRVFDRANAHNEEMRSLIRKVPTGLFALNRSLEIDEINPIAASLLGRSPADLLGKPFAASLEPDARADFERAVRKLQGGVLSETEFYLSMADEQSRRIALSANHEAAAGGHWIYGAIVDKTHLRNTEAQLAHVRQVLAGIAAGGTIAGFVDSAGVLELASDDAEFPGVARRVAGAIDLRSTIDERDWQGVEAILANADGGATTLRVRARRGSGAWLDLVFAPAASGSKRLITIREAGDEAAREHTLHESIRRYQASFDDSIAPSAILDATGRYTDVSEAMASLLGYERTELEGFAFQQLTYPEDVEATAASFRRLVSGETTACIARRRFFHHDGHAIPVLIRAVAIPSETGTSTEFLLTMVTLERVQELEQRLSEVSSRYDALVNALPIVTFTSPRDVSDTLNLFYSPQVEAMLGHPIEYLTRDIDRYYEFIHPDDIDRVNAADLLAENESSAFDETYRFIRGDGRTIWLRAQSVPVFHESDEAIYWQGILTDVTVLKQSEIEAKEREARLRDLIANAPLLIATIDRDAAIVTINEAVERMLGYPASDLTSGQLALDVHPDDRDTLRSLFTRTLQNPGTADTVDVRFKHRAGHWVRFRLDVINRSDSHSPAEMLVYGLPIES